MILKYEKSEPVQEAKDKSAKEYKDAEKENGK